VDIEHRSVKGEVGQQIALFVLGQQSFGEHFSVIFD
jgi:hypothetical protein